MGSPRTAAFTFMTKGNCNDQQQGRLAGAVRAEDGLVLTDHLYPGQNRLVPPGTYTPDWDAGAVDTVTFLGTARDDTLLGGGGEFASILPRDPR